MVDHYPCEHAATKYHCEGAQEHCDVFATNLKHINTLALFAGVKVKNAETATTTTAAAVTTIQSVSPSTAI